MKKTKIMALAMSVLLLLGNASCSNNEALEASIQENSNEFAAQSLEGKIVAYNKEIFGETERDTRRPKFFRWFWKVVVADAVGAVLGSIAGPGGAVVGATTASGLVSIPAVNDRVNVTVGSLSADTDSTLTDADSLFQYHIPSSVFDKDPYSEIVPQNPLGHGRILTAADSIGYFHNRALILLNNDKPNWMSLSNRAITKELSKRVLYVTGWTKSESEAELPDSITQVIESTNEKIINAVSDGGDVYEICGNLAQKYPDKNDELGILAHTIVGIQGCSTSGMKSLEYVEKILDMVDDSNVDAEVKARLRSGIIVANASSKLWNPEVIGLKE